MKKKTFLFLIILSFFGFSVPGSSRVAFGEEDSLLTIQALPGQNSVKSGMMFLVQAQVVNSSSGSSVGFWCNTCSYEKHWVTDNPEVLIQPWTCNENSLEQITLNPGDVYGKNIILYIPNKDKTGPVTFRLGFNRMSEDGDVAEPLWSDPITMNVIVPEETKEVTSSAAPNVTSQADEQASLAPAEMSEIPSTGVADFAAPMGNQPRVFQDPGVPIQIQPGEEFSIALVSTPSTGFRWKMTLPEDQQTIKLVSSEHVPPQEVMPGAPGEEVFKFKAITPGATNVNFVYERPWEAKTAPTRKIFTILVQEN